MLWPVDMPQELQGIKDQLLDIEGGKGGGGTGGWRGGDAVCDLPLTIRRCQSLHNTENSAPSHVERPRSLSSSLSTHGSVRLHSAESEPTKVHSLQVPEPRSPPPSPTLRSDRKKERKKKNYIPVRLILMSSPKLCVSELSHPWIMQSLLPRHAFINTRSWRNI